MATASKAAEPHPSAAALLETYDRLVAAYGPQRWWPEAWPGRADYICAGAILCQNTNWANAAKALQNLADAGLTRVADLAGLEQPELAELIRPAGYFRQKARKLVEFANLCQSHGSLEGLLALPTAKLRSALLDCWGIGPETADAILLFAARRPTFVIDTYAVRIWSRLGLIGDDPDRGRLRQRVLAAITPGAELAGEYHALLIQHGKNHCRKRPLCGDCPLRDGCAYAAANPGGARLGRRHDGWSEPGTAGRKA